MNIFGANLVGIHHIGSTAVPDLLAKPIIDLMAEVRNLRACDDVTKAMTIFGYEAMGTNGIAGRRYFRKFDKDRRRTHHLHVFGQGSEHLERHLAFRDYLIAHPEEAKQYSALKQRLVAIDDGDWDAYVVRQDQICSGTGSTGARLVCQGFPLISPLFGGCLM